MREICDELHALSLAVDSLTRRVLVSGFALQFSQLYQFFCKKNRQMERRELHDRLIHHILTGEQTASKALGDGCDMFVFDTNIEQNLIETEGAFEAALFAYYACVDADYSGDAVREFTEFVTGLNASKNITHKEIEMCFDYGEFIVCEEVASIIRWHIDFLRGSLSSEDYIEKLSNNVISVEVF